MQYLQVLNPLCQAPCGKMDLDKQPQIPLQVIRSARRTIAIQIKEDGAVLLRVPSSVTNEEAVMFASQHQDWILSHRHRAVENQRKKAVYGEVEIREYKKSLRPLLESRADYFAGQLGVSFGRISIRDQKTRWGSCSSAGNLNFNWKLALVPPEVLDYVVVHELAHRLEMNHSASFWARVEQILPDYKKRRAWLKEYGGAL